MRSRWYHLPVLHVPRHGEGKRVSWLELFYDLIFVAGIIQLGDWLSEDVSVGGFALFSLHFVPLWIAWTGFTFYANRFDVDDFLHRALVLGQMFAVGAMAISSHAAMSGSHRGFSVALAVALGVVALLNARAWHQVPEAREYGRYWGLVFGAAAAMFATSAFLPLPHGYLLWAGGIATILFAPVSRPARALAEQLPLDQEHLGERYGLLTIIVLGESFVKVLTYLTGSGHALDLSYQLKGFFNLTLTVCLWWIYFDDVAGSHIKRQRGAWTVWLYGHLPLTLGVTAVGVAVKKAVKFDLAAVAPEPYRWLLAGSLAVALLSVALVDSVTARRNAILSDHQRVIARTVSALVVLLLGQVGGEMAAGTFLALVAAVCVAQVLFDIAMAPLEESAASKDAVSIADVARRAREEGAVAQRAPRVDVRDAVRKGAPAELRRDLYFFFLEGSWTRLFLTFGFAYLFINVVFGGLYLLEDGSFQGGGGFATAFNFSVQTMATIGYGVLSPATPYGNMLVTVEAAVGMLFVAMATGLMLAKASRPQSSVLFSQHVVRTRRHGEPTLMLRLANARGNEVVDARVTVSVLVDEVSAEGHHMRRVLDLPLQRNHQPLFALSWTLVHNIGPGSPLHGLAEDRILALVVTFLGHDGTYGTTTYARHIYTTDDLKQDHRFVDVMSQLPDGRLVIDLGKFHDVVPDPG